MNFQEHYAFRGELITRLERDLVGPTDTSEETITDAPITKYAMGILFPQSAGTVDDTQAWDEEPESGHAHEAPDPAVAMANVRYPSSMGLTFAVDAAAATEVLVEVQAARYVPLAMQEVRRSRTSVAGTESWRRVSLHIAPQRIDVSLAGQRSIVLDEGLELFVRVRPPSQDGVSAITLVLVNRFQSSGTTAERDSQSFFQPRITVRGGGGSSVFVERPPMGSSDSDAERRAYRLVYRHAPAFATGHGCAVEWEPVEVAINDVTTVPTVGWIRTTFIPTHDLRLADSNPAIDVSGLGMHRLATVSDAEVIASLRTLTSGYREWIENRRNQLAHLSSDGQRTTAAEHLAKCVVACDRMDAGIALLADPVAMEAFRLANRAMAMQRARTEWLKTSDRGTTHPDDTVGVWRPFQIAFLLLSLRGIADRTSDDRDVADVLWFPTGGGKTEAYLGLIAFTTFLRRLRNPRDGAGVTVLMRYTLRLLTVQQFERAALLMCCMEYLRRSAGGRLGEAEISIGMWVGRGSTPNKLDEAKRSLRKLAKGEEVQEENPVQIRSCCWCGTAIDHQAYTVVADRLVISCGSDRCDFADGLPVHVVDETIYQTRPTLIIATADKFAGIPWKPEIGNLFNHYSAEPPPDLIIQDELHLISGPLGTLAGLYETVVDLVCDRPKVVASTATIRRAIQQGLALFDRDVEQFPPPGLDARDSYFSVETPPSGKASRLYVGLMAPATSQTSLMVRTYAALLHHSQAIEGNDAVRDTYWTLLGYFNSLRLLAGAKLQVQDDINDRLDHLSESLGHKRRDIGRDIELTSREPSSAIPVHLQDMATTYPEALGIILATNMISVGVDVDRLGLMVVMGQPQSTSEYIQATSRVGRRWPGLVAVLLNAARSRDRSHYENFTAYHSALYRQVEATSVTPFSSRARDRGLHATVVGLARLMIEAARPKDAAASIGDFEDELRAICDRILDRVQRVAGQAERDATAGQIDDIIMRWRDAATADPNLVYGTYRQPGLLVDAARWDEHDDLTSQSFPTLWSLRDVDVESTIYLDRGTR